MELEIDFQEYPKITKATLVNVFFSLRYLKWVLFNMNSETMFSLELIRKPTLLILNIMLVDYNICPKMN